MSCPSELTLSIHADGELPAGAAAAVGLHLAACGRCRELAAGLAAENRLLRAALELSPAAVAAARTAVPVRLGAAAGSAIAAAVALRALGGLVSGGLDALPDWLNPLTLAGGLNLLLNALFYLLRAGGAVMEWSGSLISSMLPMLAATLVMAWAWRRRPRLLMAALTLLLAVLAAAPAAALEVRAGQNVEVAAGETLDGSVILAGETVRVEGQIDGDVLAFARDVTVRGTVSGGVYAFGQQVNLEGESGAAHGFGQWVRLAGAAMGNGYFAGQGITLLPGSRVEGDVMMAGETLAVEGAVLRDVTAAGRRAEIRGAVGRHVQTWTDEVAVVDGASVGGDLEAHLPAEEHLTVAAGPVSGDTTVELVEPEAAGKSRYGDPGFYLWRLAGLVGAFLVGAVLWQVAPGLLGGRLAGAGPVLMRLGVGLLVLIGLPIALLVVAVTIVGLPLAVIGLLLYGIALYLAKIAVADLLGRGLLGWPEETPRRALPALLLGLAVIAVATALPWLGGWLGFLVLLLGLGLMTLRIWPRLRGAGATLPD